MHVIVQPYGITCNHIAVLVKLKREYKDASSLNFGSIRASDELRFKNPYMMNIDQIVIETGGILELFGFALNSHNFPYCNKMKTKCVQQK